ncbi:MAG: glycosyltransferase [Chlamydiae bacterium]|nr:glycosyltransferase [Chlamydiota bacterium]
MQTICLNMIVRNEAKVIRRALSSVKHKIDYWVIVDTGSTDDTKTLILEELKNIPGELHERPWVDFEHNRNEALELAIDKASYLLFIDADEQWIFSQDFDKQSLSHNFYVVKNRDLNVDLYRVLLVNTQIPWRWKGVLHEEICSTQPVQGAILPGITNYGFIRDGYRASDPERYLKDAEILEKALLNEPDNARYVFFLAQSYATAGKYQEALKNYDKRTKMGGFEPEIFWSYFSIGCLRQDLKMDPKLVVESYCHAHLLDPMRAEPLHHLAAFYQDQNNQFLAYLITQYALTLPPPTSLSYILRDVYDHLLLSRFAVAAHHLGKLEEAKESYERLLANPDIPPETRHIAEHNLKQLLTPNF